MIARYARPMIGWANDTLFCSTCDLPIDACTCEDCACRDEADA